MDVAERNGKRKEKKRKEKKRKQGKEQNGNLRRHEVCLLILNHE
jgi:hypothetical protein